MSVDPVFTLNTLRTVLIEPFLSVLGLYTPPDSTYGRYLLPTTDAEKELEQRSGVTTRMRRIFVDGKGRTAEDVQLVPEELKSGKGREWIFYKTWERFDPEAEKGKGKGRDVLVFHGMSRVAHDWCTS